MDAIVLAAGKGIRMNIECPKQFLKINGKPCFIYTLEILNQCKKITNIILTCNDAYFEDYQKYILTYNIKNTKCVLGGNTRQASVYNALKYVNSTKVLIHEAARPLISVDFVEEILSYSEEDAVVPTIPISFTVAQGNQYMEKELDRSQLHNIQLPQLFTTRKLKIAHQSAIKDNYVATEDGMLVFKYGVKVRFIKGREANIKITTPLDIEIVEKLLKL